MFHPPKSQYLRGFSLISPSLTSILRSNVARDKHLSYGGLEGGHRLDLLCSIGLWSRSRPSMPLTWSVSWSLILVGHRSSCCLLNLLRHDSNVRFSIWMSGFLPSQILGWHSATGSATPIVKRFKLYITSNPDTRIVSVALLYLIQCNFSGIYTP